MKQFRDYELKEEMGTGAYGSVFRATQPGMDRDVAVKVIQPRHASEASFFTRFEAEAQLVAQLEHPHIVPVHDYWRDEDNAYTFRNGWHHTGDIGRFDEDGFLYYVKRKAEKELIKPGGENVYPAEVEKVILEHEAVAEASVIGVADKQWGEAIKAVVAFKEGMSVEPDELTEFVAGKIARYKKPKYVDVVDALPKTDDGDIDRDTVKKNHGAKY